MKKKLKNKKKIKHTILTVEEKILFGIIVGAVVAGLLTISGILLG